MLVVSQLAKSYQITSAVPPLKVLHDVSFTVRSGEVVALVGHSGSGKSTLLSLLGGLESPDSGTIIVDDVAIAGMSETALAAWRGTAIGFVFQQFHLLPYLTALDNVALPLDIAGQTNTTERAQSALEAVGLAHRIDHLPHMMSGGECQRVAIARAIVSQPKLLIADEPTGNLDSKNGELIIEQLFALAKQHNTTLLIATHSNSLATRCTRVLSLSDGVLADGTQDQSASNQCVLN